MASDTICYTHLGILTNNMICFVVSRKYVYTCTLSQSALILQY